MLCFRRLRLYVCWERDEEAEEKPRKQPCGVLPGADGCYLAGFKGSFPEVPASVEVIGPPVAGAVDGLGKENKQLARYLYNDVKVCAKCGRPCACTQKSCQCCGALLDGVPVTQTENVMMGFIFGVERTRQFPLVISIRRQTDDSIVFDDLLAMSSCHFNALPTRQYLPDWRWLLRDPGAAKRLLDTLEAEAWQATLAFLQQEDWRKFVYREGVTPETVRENVICGFNSPPSQFQLHMQWIVPPLLPFHHHRLLLRTHAQQGRWFPLEYVRQLLDILDAAGESFDTQAETSTEDIIAHFAARGVAYDAVWTRCYERYCASYRALGKWKPDDFSYVACEDKLYDIQGVLSDGRVLLGEEARGADPARVQEGDKLLLQNYGRKYRDNGKPGGTYYKHHKAAKIGEGGIQIWPGIEVSC